MIHLIVQQPELAPDLRNLLDENEDNLTRSAQETRQLMKTGRSIEQLASIRRLAISTIQDHLVEMALKIRHFDCSPYVSQEQEHRIREIVRRLKTRQLKPLKARLGEQATYFQIRLILAKTSMEERGEITNV
nr:helix-turn-helix domain-containing protein [Sporolactobacillus spathodeae]